MNENDIPMLLNVLVTLWERAITREKTLQLVLKDVSPDWAYQYRDYWNEPETLESVMKTTYPMRAIIKAAIQGDLTPAMMQEAAAELQRKPE